MARAPCRRRSDASDRLRARAVLRHSNVRGGHRNAGIRSRRAAGRDDANAAIARHAGRARAVARRDRAIAHGLASASSCKRATRGGRVVSLNPLAPSLAHATVRRRRVSRCAFGKRTSSNDARLRAAGRRAASAGSRRWRGRFSIDTARARPRTGRHCKRNSFACVRSFRRFRQRLAPCSLAGWLLQLEEQFIVMTPPRLEFQKSRRSRPFYPRRSTQRVARHRHPHTASAIGPFAIDRATHERSAAGRS